MCVLLTQCSVVEGEVSQVSRVLWQGEESPGVTVPHQAAPGAVLQHSVLDDLHKERESDTLDKKINQQINYLETVEIQINTLKVSLHFFFCFW